MRILNNRILTVFFTLSFVFLITNCSDKNGAVKSLTEQSSTSAGDLSDKALEMWPQAQEAFQNFCVDCHNSTGQPDFSQIDVVLSKATLITERVSNNSMPQPGSTEASSITQADRDIILNWIIEAGSAAQTTPPADEDTSELGVANKKLNTCMACHGTTGVSTDLNTPNLGGLTQDYIKSQLDSFANGNRTNAIMESQVTGLTTFEIDYITLALSSSNEINSIVDDSNPPTTVEELALYDLGQTLAVEKGCTNCHLSSGTRGPGSGQAAQAPGITRQKSAYLKLQLENFISDKRITTSTFMGNLSSTTLTTEDIEAITYYFEHLN